MLFKNTAIKNDYDSLSDAVKHVMAEHTSDDSKIVNLRIDTDTNIVAASIENPHGAVYINIAINLDGHVLYESLHKVQ